MKKKYYAVKNGRIKGVYFSWEDCKSMIEGYPNASYKSFQDPYEAMDFVIGEKNIGSSEDMVEEQDSLKAYVDGSYNVSTGEYGLGGVIIENGSIIHEFSQKGMDEEASSMRNVAGEIEASKYAINYALENGYKEITIYHDYNGIEKWCSGEWKANKNKTKEYKAFYDRNKDSIKIKFIKVKSHSGDKYNDIADALSKQSIF